MDEVLNLTPNQKGLKLATELRYMFFYKQLHFQRQPCRF